MALHPEIAAVLDALAPDLDASRGLAAFTPGPAGRVLPPAASTSTLRVTDHLVPVVVGVSVPVRSWVPLPVAGPRRAVMVLHGGGFVSGSPAAADPVLRRLAVETGSVVVAPTYRLAPGNPHPAAHHDVLATLRWLAAGDGDDAAAVDPTRIVLFGVSAGGGLAAGAALHVRDLGGPAIARLVLGFPALDPRGGTPSARSVTDPRIWNGPLAALAWRAYLGDVAAVDASPHAAPALASSLAGLPPMTLTVNGLDPLRDEGLTFAARARADGIEVDLHDFPDTFHGSLGYAPDAPPSRAELAVFFGAVRAV